jgi:hypothetical protein
MATKERRRMLRMVMERERMVIGDATSVVH